MPPTPAEKKAAAEAATTTPAEDAPQTDATPAEAGPEVNVEPEGTGPAPTEPTLAEARTAADVALASAQARYYAGSGSAADVEAAKTARAALRR